MMGFVHVVALVGGGAAVGWLVRAVYREITQRQSKITLADAIVQLEWNNYVKIGKSSVLWIDNKGFSYKHRFGKTIFQCWNQIEGYFTLQTPGPVGQWQRFAAYHLRQDGRSERDGIFRLIRSVMPRPLWNKRLPKIDGLDPEEVVELLNAARLRFSTR